MERQVYQVGCHVIEARELRAMDGMPSPFVKVTVRDQEQVTPKQENTSQALFNTRFSFTDIEMNRYELE